MNRSVSPALRSSRLQPSRSRHRGSSLGLRPHSTPELINEVGRGLPFTALESLAATSGLPLPALADAARIPTRTLARRKSDGRLAPDESERLLRVATLFEAALELFEGDAPGAARWMMTPRRALANETPLDYARTELGAREAEALIGRLEHGVFV